MSETTSPCRCNNTGILITRAYDNDDFNMTITGFFGESLGGYRIELCECVEARFLELEKRIVELEARLEK